MTYSEYVTKLFTIPFCTWLLGMLVLIGSILLLIRFMQSNAQKERQKPGILMLKSLPLAYNENGITITAIYGRQFFCKWDDVISVTQTYPPFFRLYPAPCIKVTYRTESGREESMYYTIGDYVGTKRFELYAERYIGQKTEEK